MRKLALTISLSASAFLLHAGDTPSERLQDATNVFNEIMATPDKGIPQDLLEKAHCVVIVPGLKQAGFVVGAKYGKGYAVCRRATNHGWGAPEAIRIEGGSFGFQIGASSTDVVMLIMNERGMRRLSEDKFTLGAEASVAAGPVGRQTSAMTDAQLSAEILSWSRSKGLFAGIALTGATLRPDNDDNQELYGRKVDAKEILSGDVTAPASARPLSTALGKYSWREEKNKPIETRAKDKITDTDADRKKK
jgi:lipid-binding SYLF domain-containing protein